MKFRSQKIDRLPIQIDIKDELLPEHELLQLRLALASGMDGITPSLNPEIQNQWLKNIYNFEEQSKDACPIKLFDFLGQPEFRKTDDLSAEEVSLELDRVLSLLGTKGMALDCSTEYDNSVIYRFVTEELFEHEVDNVSVEGMVTHFIYEEFHPNHDHDLRRYSEELVEILFRKKWDRFDAHHFARDVMFNNCSYDVDGIASIIQTFQEAHNSFSVEQFDVEDVTFDLENQHAEILGTIRYDARGNGNRAHGGTCKINFTFQWGFWYISGFRFPGFGD